jgi:hypothetical protein
VAYDFSERDDAKWLNLLINLHLIKARFSLSRKSVYKSTKACNDRAHRLALFRQPVFKCLREVSQFCAGPSPARNAYASAGHKNVSSRMGQKKNEFTRPEAAALDL